MNNIIALITDFGTRDYFVGAMKGVILSINAAAQIVDITHEIPAQDIGAASFNLRACYENFPRKTIFVAVVDPGVGSARRAILVEAKDYYFIAPDNGLLSFIFNREENFRVFELSDERFFLRPLSRTFHGRDVFAPCAAHLSKGVNPAEFGVEIKDFIFFAENDPRKISETEIEAEIIHVDRFGNLITNLKKEELTENFFVEINETNIDIIRSYYAEAEKDELFLIAGSAGFLEIAAFENSAAKLLNAARGQKIFVRIAENQK
jgi:hypothetical protein